MSANSSTHAQAISHASDGGEEDVSSSEGFEAEIQPDEEVADNDHQDPPLTGLSALLLYFFTRNYEPMRPLFRWLVIHGRYLRYLWKGIGFPNLAYCMYCLIYKLGLQRFDTQSSNFIVWGCKVTAICCGVVIFNLHNSIWRRYRRWERSLAGRRDRARHIPAFMRNGGHVFFATLFAILSMLVGQWVKPSVVELQICTSLASYFFCMSMSRRTFVDFGLVDGIVALVLSLLYVLEHRDIRNFLIVLTSIIPASKYALIPFNNLIKEWIGPIALGDVPNRPWWCGPEALMYVVAGIILVAYFR